MTNLIIGISNSDLSSFGDNQSIETVLKAFAFGTLNGIEVQYKDTTSEVNGLKIIECLLQPTSNNLGSLLKKSGEYSKNCGQLSLN